MATGQVAMGVLKLGDNADTSKNFLIKTPAVADGTLTIQRENGTQLLTINSAGIITGGTGSTLISNGPAFIAIGSAGTITAGGGFTDLHIAKVRDSSNAYTASTGIFNPQIAGWYQLNACLEGTAASAGTAETLISVAGGNYIGNTMITSTTTTRATCACLVYMNGTTDTAVFRGAASTSNLTTGGNTHFSGCLVRAA